MYKHAAILFAQGVQDEEFIYPYYRLQEDGFKVKTLFIPTQKYNQPIGKYGIQFPVTRSWDKFHDDYFIHQATECDILIIPGGWQCPEILRMSDIVRRVVREFAYRSKIIAAICHGPQVLISADVGKSKSMTGFEGIHDDITNYSRVRPPCDERVVHDGNFGYDLITAQHYKDNPEFMKKILEVYYNEYVPSNYQG